MDQPQDNPYRPGEPVVTTRRGPATVRVLLVVIAVLMVIDLYLLVGVVPKFRTMFDALKGELPPLTHLVLGLSWHVQTWILPLLAVIGLGGWFAYRHAERIPLLFPVTAIVILGMVVVITPLAIFYPVMQLQAAVRGDPPPSQQPPGPSRSP